MQQKDLLQQIDELKDKLNKAQRQVTGLRQKSKYLEMQYEDSRTREQNNNGLVMELLERQRELNVMLNRANIMLNRTQEAMALSSMELNEMAKALPEPKKAEWADRVAKVNELFKKTGIQDAELGALESSNPEHPSDSFNREELKKESEEAFGRKQSIWNCGVKPQPPRVEAEIVEEAPSVEPISDVKIITEDKPEMHEPEIIDIDEHDDQINEDQLIFPPRKKSWWQRLAG